MDVIITTLVLLVVAMAGTTFFTFCCWDNMKSLALRCNTNAERWHSHQYEVKELREAWLRSHAKLRDEVEDTRLEDNFKHYQNLKALGEALGYIEVDTPAVKSKITWTPIKRVRRTNA